MHADSTTLPSDPSPSPFVEHYRRAWLRGEIDIDVAEMQVVAYLNRATAVRAKRLDDIPRPVPVKATLAPLRKREAG